MKDRCSTLLIHWCILIFLASLRKVTYLYNHKTSFSPPSGEKGQEEMQKVNQANVEKSSSKQMKNKIT